MKQCVQPSTDKRYAVTWRRWEQFCALDAPHDPFAITPSHLPYHEQVGAVTRYTSYLEETCDCSHQNIDAHLAGLRYHWKCRFMPTTALDDPAVAACRRAYRLDPRCQPASVGPRAPLTWQMLESIVHEGSNSLGSVAHMSATSCLLAFCCLFRVSEVAATSPLNTHRATAGCVEFQINKTAMLPAHLISSVSFSQVTAVRITQYTAKNRAAHERPAVLWFSADPLQAGDPLDLPFALFTWAVHAQFTAPSNPFFSTPSPHTSSPHAGTHASPAGPPPAPAERRRPLTSDMLRAAIKACAIRFGLDPALFGTHSLKIGGASHLTALGVPAHILQRAGRWKSLPVSLQYPARSAAEQDALLRTFREPSRFLTTDLLLSHNLPPRPSSHRTTP